jgi:hypothetical protein
MPRPTPESCLPTADTAAPTAAPGNS